MPCMVYELVQSVIEPVEREDYVAAWRAAWKKAAFEGAHSAQVLRCDEDPAKVAFLIKWESIETHKRHVGTERHNAFRAALAPYLKIQPNDVKHYSIESFGA